MGFVTSARPHTHEPAQAVAATLSAVTGMLLLVMACCSKGLRSHTPVGQNEMKPV